MVMPSDKLLSVLDKLLPDKFPNIFPKTMLTLKIVFLLAVVVPNILAAGIWYRAYDSPESLESPETLEIFDRSLEDLHHIRINYGPVWDDIAGENEFVVKAIGKKGKCTPDSSKGLANLFSQSKKLIPWDNVKEIVKSYANDPEVKTLKAYIESADYKEKVAAIRSSEEYKTFSSYVCHVLHLDLQEDGHYVARNRLRSSSQTGIRGLIRRVQSVIPYRQLGDLYAQLISKDDQLLREVAAMKSKEFKRIVSNLRNYVPAYRELTMTLWHLGVPLDQLKGVISNALGWNMDWDTLP
ncbi:uncharacterized protein LOC133327000 [Musca vetustissima]|uniref:uncharacterized protein LOC133327000 n=1 Tax=Musca vetustissima TaxID=27455 RepID=UPI002AB631D7|nr:uncharacterized protein LOC133327000 [Musca vetustissima]